MRNAGGEGFSLLAAGVPVAVLLDHTS